MSRQSISLLFFLLVFGEIQAQKTIPTIDTERFGSTELLWDLKALSKAPDFSWLDSTSAVRSLTYESVPNGGKPTRVFAYYSNPDLLMGRKTSRKFPGVVLVHGDGAATSPVLSRDSTIALKLPFRCMAAGTTMNPTHSAKKLPNSRPWARPIG